MSSLEDLVDEFLDASTAEVRLVFIKRSHRKKLLIGSRTNMKLLS